MSAAALQAARQPLEAYKEFVRNNASLITNLERLAHWVAWSPDRFQGSEFAYEAFNSAVGLVGLFNDSIIHGEVKPDGSEGTDWGFMLAALEQVRFIGVGAVVSGVGAHAHALRCAARAVSCARAFAVPLLRAALLTLRCVQKEREHPVRCLSHSSRVACAKVAASAALGQQPGGVTLPARRCLVHALNQQPKRAHLSANSILPPITQHATRTIKPS